MTHAPSTSRDHGRERGQVIVIFAGGILLFMLLLAIVLDVSWYWANTLRVQRAADAAALAGAVYLPGEPSTANTRAIAEARKNGYINGTNATVTPVQDTSNPRQLNVSVSADVGTFFMRVVGIQTIRATRASKAEYVMPVPMGSPENYYGTFGTIRGATFTGPGQTDTGWKIATAWPSGSPANSWSNASEANANNNNSYAVSTTADGSLHRFGTFGFTFTPTVTSIDGIEVRLRALYTGSGNPTTTCQLDASLSWDTGTTWTAIKSQVLTGTEALYTLGSTADTWGRTWTEGQLSNANFRLRLAFNKVSCGANRTASVDTLEVRTTYSGTDVAQNLGDVVLKGPGTVCANGRTDCFKPDGSLLNARGFWGTMNTRGASNVNGDAHQPEYDTAGGTLAPICPIDDFTSCYDPDQYYNYAVEMPPNSTGGYVYVFDAGFCSTVNNKGTGDRWFGGSNAVSSWYELYDTVSTPYNLGDDTLVATSGTRFENMDATDTTMGGTGGGAECKQKATTYGDGRDYHNSWFLLNPGNPLTGGPVGTIYRLHTTGTPSSGTAQRTTDGEQSFALYMTANSGAPRIYGYGAMQMFTPLSASGAPTSSEFYLAQIKAEDAGKTMEILLWDPGDTSPLTANVQILTPTVSAWTPVQLSYQAHVGTTNGTANAACNSNTGTLVTSIATEATGANPGEFNGCWLKISIEIPDNYQAYQSGWWKIRYNMNGTGTSNDVTTWKVAIFGNPVHLKVP